jgi:glycosyltransferase involved in cell wall biosynthesis
MRVAMLVQKVDERDWLMAFALKWIRALAARVDRLDVITLEQREADLPKNVFVQTMGKERGYSRPRELWMLYRALGRVIRDVDVVFSHMTPRYTWLSAPLAAVYGKPQLMWYTHRQIGWELRLALAASVYAVTAAPESFPLQSPKVRAVGHGIDTDFFRPDDRCPLDDPPLIVQVARLMPIKHQATLLQAVAAVPDIRVAFLGGVPSGQDPAYLNDLRALARDLGIADRVTFTGGLQPEEVRDFYRRATVSVNLSPPGLFDKAALESMLVGTPTIVSSSAFDTLLGDHGERLRLSAPDDAAALAARLRSLLALSGEERSVMGLDIRARVQTAHSLDGLMDRLVALMAEACQQGL